MTVTLHTIIPLWKNLFLNGVDVYDQRLINTLESNFRDWSINGSSGIDAC